MATAICSSPRPAPPASSPRPARTSWTASAGRFRCWPTAASTAATRAAMSCVWMSGRNEPEDRMFTTRRQFIQTAAAAGAALSAPFILGAHRDQKFRTALIGCGWWGKNVLHEAMASGRCKVTALCDVDPSKLEVTGDQVNDQTGDTPKPYKDFRELLDKEKPEVVIVSTP